MSKFTVYGEKSPFCKQIKQSNIIFVKYVATPYLTTSTKISILIPIGKTFLSCSEKYIYSIIPITRNIEISIPKK